TADPGAKPAPICVAGFTDSHWFREAFGTVAYGFFPSRAMPIETAARLIHSADERVPGEDLELGVSFLQHAAKSLLSKSGEKRRSASAGWRWRTACSCTGRPRGRVQF